MNIEILYQTFFESVPFSIIWADLNGTIINSNSTTEKIFGYTKEDLIGKNYAEVPFYPVEFLPRLTEKYEALLKGEFGDPIEIQAYKKDGSLIWVNFQGSLIQLGKNAIIQVISQDITEEKLIKLELKQQTDLLQKTYDSLIDAIFILNAHNPPKILECNEAASTTFGYNKTEMIGKTTAFLHVNKESLKEFQSLLFPAMEEIPLKFFYLPEFRMKRKDGSVFISEHSVAQLLDDNGKRIGWVSNVRDITERKQTEEALKKSEAKYRTLVENATDFIYMIDRDLKVISVNKAAAMLWGENPEDIIGKSIHAIFPKEIVEGFSKKLKTVFKTGKSIMNESKLIVGEKELWTSVNLNPIQDEDGKIVAVMGITRDISDHRRIAEVERQFTTIIQTTLDGFWITDLAGRFLDVNNLYCQMIGYTREELLMMSVSDVEVAEQPEETALHIKKLLERGHDRFETRHRRNDGEIIDLEISANYSDLGEGQLVVFLRDITERKRIETALLESEERYRELADSITDIFFAMDKDLRYTYWNRASEQLTNISAEDAIGKSIFEIFPDNEGTKNAVKVYLEVLNTQQSQSFVNEFHLDGNQFFFEITAYPSKEGLSVFVKDITERKQMETMLQESEKKFRNIIENVKDAVVIIGLDGKFHFISPQLSEMLGGREIGEDLGSIVPLIHKDDIKPVLNVFQKTTKAKRRLTPEEVEFRALHQDGHYIWLSSSSKVHYEENGKIIGFIVSLRDITARKQAEEELKGAEEKFRTLFENAPASITLLDKSGRVIDCNKSTEELTGYSREEILGNHFEELMTIDPKDFSKVMGQYEQLLKGLEVEPFDLEIITKNGEKRWISGSVSISLKGTQIVGFQVIANDITARKIAEENLKQAIEDLKELDRLKDEFYSDISHEYRTPLTVIKGFTELLVQSNNLTEDQKVDLEIIQKNELRLERVVNNILEYSRLKAGRIPLKKDKFRVSDICTDLKKELAPLIKQKQLVIMEKINPNEEIIFDRYYITSVIKNFLVNAIKFSFPNGKIIITSNINDGVWTFSMRDFGIGIPKEEIPKIFNRFVKLKSSEMMNPDGIGIGLAICKNIIDIYGGKVWAESDGLNKGAIFIFQLNYNNSEIGES